jgi:hypothetical protein
VRDPGLAARHSCLRIAKLDADEVGDRRDDRVHALEIGVADALEDLVDLERRRGEHVSPRRGSPSIWRAEGPCLGGRDGVCSAVDSQ